MKKLKNPLTLLVLIIVAASFSAPFGTPQLAAFAKDFLPAVATLIAAYVGASYGATLVRDAAKEDERKRQIGAGARAMFTLWRQINIVAQIQMNFVDDYRDNPSVVISLPPIDYPLDELPRLDLDSLAFFLDLGNAEILEALVIAEQNFLHAIDVVRTRSTLHYVEVQPILEKIIPNGGTITHVSLEQALGPRLFSQLIDQTKRLIFRVDRSIEDLDKVADELYAALKKGFPNAKFPRPSKPESE
ncbi:hypothetical protein GIB64_28535 [Pseudomonas lactis]|uniref:hypothetical protein n=1 Tax=Pseudomonas TaxID=286 RepID=UPI000BB6225A|nr:MULTISPECIES: hypothetical protein [Pseudomonas]MBA5961379.1 hypothetical protein [Pseudomonas lactis]PRW71513.1 hypothetical protein C7A12_27910 [Pseudomonas fluorescens]PRW72069.1 hypothetical protein C7A13_28205 [Pseudomonas fluorescens]